VDFSAWFEVFLQDRWVVFDARHNFPRCGRVLIARGRDAADVPFLRSFGAHQLSGFQVITEAIAPNAQLEGTTTKSPHRTAGATGIQPLSWGR
jgi:transglutaminase-like putative cysteine protease